MRLARRDVIVNEAARAADEGLILDARFFLGVMRRSVNVHAAFSGKVGERNIIILDDRFSTTKTRDANGRAARGRAALSRA
ncbi:MAG: hypothetical protein IRZ09_04490 [Variibacter sp.]|nr:hypothetical protein [Variibacter sp.]